MSQEQHEFLDQRNFQEHEREPNAGEVHTNAGVRVAWSARIAQGAAGHQKRSEDE